MLMLATRRTAGIRFLAGLLTPFHGGARLGRGFLIICRVKTGTFKYYAGAAAY